MIKYMTKQVALLRGINVGGNSKVEMPRLKKLFENLGFDNVSTYINSGNVIFDSAGKVDVDLIEKELEKEFGFSVRVVIHDSQNILDLCKKIPKDWTNDDEQKTDILFLWEKYDNKKSLELIKATEVDNLKYLDGAIVWNIKRKDYKKSAMNKFIGTDLYKHMTARNINTVRKLGERVI